MHQNLVQQAHDTSAIKQIVDFINDLLANVSVVLITTWARNTKVEDIHHGNPKALVLSHLLSCTLFCFKTTYILEAISTLRFM